MTAAEIVAADFYDALKDEKLYGLCIAVGTDDEFAVVEGNFSDYRMALRLISSLIACESKKTSVTEEGALAAILCYSVRLILKGRTGELNVSKTLSDGEVKILSDVLRLVSACTDKAGRRELKKALEV